MYEFVGLYFELLVTEILTKTYLMKTDVVCLTKLSFVLQKAFLNFVPKATYTRKLAEELMVRAR
jgi:hypothetical protein